MQKVISAVLLALLLILAGCNGSPRAGNASQATTTLGPANGSPTADSATATESETQPSQSGESSPTASPQDGGNEGTPTELPRTPLTPTGEVAIDNASTAPYPSSLPDGQLIVNRTRTLVEQGPNFTIGYLNQGFTSDGTLAGVQRASLVITPDSENETLESRDAGYFIGDVSFFYEAQQFVHIAPQGFYRYINDSQQEVRIYVREDPDIAADLYRDVISNGDPDRYSNYDFEYLGTNIDDGNESGLNRTLYYYRTSHTDIISPSGYQYSENPHDIIVGVTPEGRVVFTRIYLVGQADDRFATVAYTETHRRLSDDTLTLRNASTSWVDRAEEVIANGQAGVPIPYTDEDEQFQ